MCTYLLFVVSTRIVWHLHQYTHTYCILIYFLFKQIFFFNNFSFLCSFVRKKLPFCLFFVFCLLLLCPFVLYILKFKNFRTLNAIWCLKNNHSFSFLFSFPFSYGYFAINQSTEHICKSPKTNRTKEKRLKIPILVIHFSCIFVPFRFSADKFMYCQCSVFIVHVGKSFIHSKYGFSCIMNISVVIIAQNPWMQC